MVTVRPSELGADQLVAIAALYSDTYSSYTPLCRAHVAPLSDFRVGFGTGAAAAPKFDKFRLFQADVIWDSQLYPDGLLTPDSPYYDCETPNKSLWYLCWPSVDLSYVWTDLLRQGCIDNIFPKSVTLRLSGFGELDADYVIPLRDASDVLTKYAYVGSYAGSCSHGAFTLSFTFRPQYAVGNYGVWQYDGYGWSATLETPEPGLYGYVRRDTGRLGDEDPSSPSFERKDCSQDLTTTTQWKAGDYLAWPGYNCQASPPVKCIPCENATVELIDVTWPE